MRVALFFLLCTYFLICGRQNLFAQVKRPNVLFILTDDENVNTLGCYGYHVKTPNIDKLAAEGIRFTNANVVHTVCSPSRYSILTGRYYDNNYHPDFLEDYPLGTPSCVGNSISLEDDGMNVASVLRENGYTTGFVGKFHVGHHDVLTTNKTWEENGLETYSKKEDPRENTKLDAQLKANHKWWCEAIKEYGFDYVNGVYAANLRELFNENLNVHNVEWTADAAIEFINKQKDNINPFFLYVATTYPHGPAPERLVNGKYIYSLDANPSLTGEGVVEKDIQTKIEIRKNIKENVDPADDKTSVTAQWWDHSVGAIIQKLKETGQYENTLIIYTSDHGKLNSGKATLYETGVHVPLIMHWPQKISEGRVYSSLVGSIDFVPTILDVCDVKVPVKMHVDGVSFKPVLLGSNEPIREALLLRMGYACAVKTDSWKYIAVRYPYSIEKDILGDKKFKGAEEEVIPQPYYMLHAQLSQKAKHANTHYFERNQLYTYKKDTTEQNNVFSDNPEVALKMKELLKNNLEKINKRPFGEFTGKNKEEFLYLKNVVNFPEK